MGRGQILNDKGAAARYQRSGMALVRGCRELQGTFKTELCGSKSAVHLPITMFCPTTRGCRTRSSSSNPCPATCSQFFEPEGSLMFKTEMLGINASEGLERPSMNSK